MASPCATTSVAIKHPVWARKLVSKIGNVAMLVYQRVIIMVVAIRQNDLISNVFG